MDSATKVGALISREHLTKVNGYIELAKDEGCTLAFKGDLHLPDRNREVGLVGIASSTLICIRVKY